MAKPKVIAVANQKGGVGKSTSVYNIGAGLAMNGKNILLIDVDPQGDLTKMLGQRKPHDLPVTLGNALNDVVADTENSSHPEILRHHEGFDFVPANRTLSAVEVSLVNVMSRETVLRRYVNSVKKPYDYVLLDCNPSLGMLVINALSASDYVLIPVQADYLAAEDMTELVGTVQNVKKGINHNLKMFSEDCTPSHAQAIKMRKFSQEGKLNPDVILSIMQEEKPNQKEQIKIPKERISRYFAPGTPAQKIEDTIIKALELYRKRQRSMER